MRLIADVDMPKIQNMFKKACEYYHEARSGQLNDYKFCHTSYLGTGNRIYILSKELNDEIIHQINNIGSEKINPGIMAAKLKAVTEITGYEFKVVVVDVEMGEGHIC